MKEYERITMKGDNESTYDNIINCVACPNKTEKYTCRKDKTNCFKAVINRLAELEDKIENGELFSLPFIWKRKRYNTYNEYVVVYESGDGSLMGQVFCGENAEAEAKAWFKELQNAKHD